MCFINYLIGAGVRVYDVVSVYCRHVATEVWGPAVPNSLDLTKLHVMDDTGYFIVIPLYQNAFPRSYQRLNFMFVITTCLFTRVPVMCLLYCIVSLQPLMTTVKVLMKPI